MVGTKKNFLKLFIFCTMTIIWIAADDQLYNPCISALNLDNDTIASSVEEEIYVFVTPTAARIAQGAELSFLCCLYTSATGLSYPMWTFDPPIDDGKLTASLNIPYPYVNGRDLSPSTLNGIATPDVNNTNVTCTATSAMRPFISHMTRIFVLGPPPPPRPVLEVLADSVIIRWDPVFSWPEYPVTEYILTVTSSTKEQLHNVMMDNVTTFIELQANIINSEECEKLVFSVSASNELGEGEKGSVSGGFRKANGLVSSISTVQTVVFFDLEFVAQVQLSLKTPLLCPYQTLNYSFFVVEDGSNQKIEMNASNKMMDLSDIITHYVPNLSLQNHYTVYARLTTEGEENVTTKVTNFNTIVQFPCTATGDVDGTIVYALGAVCAVLMICITICLCAIGVKYCRLCLSRRKQKGRREMVNNPIYSGPIYDSVYDARGRLLNSNASTPSSVGAPEFPPPPNGNVKQLENSLMTQNFDEPQPSEPRYSSHTQSSDLADTYVKMRAKVDSNGSNDLEAMMDLKVDLVQVSDV